MLQAQALHVNPPAILLANMQEEKKSGKEEDKAPTKEMKIKLNPMDKAADNKMEVCIFLFENRNAQHWIKWRIQLDNSYTTCRSTTGATRNMKVAKARSRQEIH